MLLFLLGGGARILALLNTRDAQSHINDGPAQIAGIHRGAVVLDRQGRIVLLVRCHPPHAAKAHQGGNGALTRIASPHLGFDEESLRLRARPIAGVLNRRRDDVKRKPIGKFKDSLLGSQIDARLSNAGHITQRVLNVHDTRRARHAGDADGDRLKLRELVIRFSGSHVDSVRLRATGDAAPSTSAHSCNQRSHSRAGRR